MVVDDQSEISFTIQGRCHGNQILLTLDFALQKWRCIFDFGLQCFDTVGWAAGRASGGVLAWLSVWSEVHMHMAQLMPLLLTVSCFSKIQIGFTFLVPAHPGSLGKRAVKRMCVCVYGLCPASGRCMNWPIWYTYSDNYVRNAIFIGCRVVQ